MLKTQTDRQTDRQKQTDIYGSLLLKWRQSDLKTPTNFSFQLSGTYLYRVGNEKNKAADINC